MASENNYRLEITQQAQDNISEIINYISIDLSSPQAAERLHKNIKKAFENLIIFPFSGSMIEKKYKKFIQYRKYLVGNYIIFYTVENNIVAVIAVMHGSRSHDNLK